MGKNEWLKLFNENFIFIENVISDFFPEYYAQIINSESVGKKFHYISECKKLIPLTELTDLELKIFDLLLEDNPDTNFHN